MPGEWIALVSYTTRPVRRIAHTCMYRRRKEKTPQRWCVCLFYKASEVDSTPWSSSTPRRRAKLRITPGLSWPELLCSLPAPYLSYPHNHSRLTTLHYIREHATNLTSSVIIPPTAVPPHPTQPLRKLWLRGLKACDPDLTDGNGAHEWPDVFLFTYQ